MYKNISSPALPYCDIRSLKDNQTACLSTSCRTDTRTLYSVRWSLRPTTASLYLHRLHWSRGNLPGGDHTVTVHMLKSFLQVTTFHGPPCELTNLQLNADELTTSLPTLLKTGRTGTVKHRSLWKRLLQALPIQSKANRTYCSPLAINQSGKALRRTTSSQLWRTPIATFRANSATQTPPKGWSDYEVQYAVNLCSTSTITVVPSKQDIMMPASKSKDVNAPSQPHFPPWRDFELCET